MMNKAKFDEFKFSLRKDTIIGVDRAESYLIKIQAVKNPRKAQTLKSEYEIIQRLNQKGCQSCPKVYEFGTISKDEIRTKIDDQQTLDSFSATDFEYIIEEFVPHNRDYGLGDIILSLLEQKSLNMINRNTDSATGSVISQTIPLKMLIPYFWRTLLIFPPLVSLTPKLLQIVRPGFTTL